MKNIARIFSNDKAVIIFAIIIRIVAFVANLFVPGLQVDEAMTADNAFSICSNGTDILGNNFPVYFCTWIVGGQSALPTYLSALFVKIFGRNLFAVRFPMLVLSILGIIAFYSFLKTVFEDSKYTKIALCLAAVSPWAIFSGVYMLDCNAFGYTLLFASCFLAKAIKHKERSTLNYIVAMLFFALCFYSYIASTLLVPAMLVAIFLILMIKKKISLKNVILSVIFLFVFSLPFVLQGLTAIKVIDEFEFLNITFGGMSRFTRANDVSLGFTEIFNNLVNSFFNIFVSDISFSLLGQNLFFYGSVFAGVFVLIGFVGIAVSVIKKDGRFNFIQKTFFVGFFVGLICFCGLVKNDKLAFLYRYGVLSFVLIIFEAVGIVFVGKLLKKIERFNKINFKAIFKIYIAISLCITIGVFSFVYIPYTINGYDCTYADSYFKCLDYLEEKKADSITCLIKDQRRMMPFDLYYFYNDNSVFDFADAFDASNTEDEIRLTDKVKSISKYDDLKLTEKYYIIRTNSLSKIDHDGYSIIDMGEFTILEKQYI